VLAQLGLEALLEVRAGRIVALPHHAQAPQHLLDDRVVEVGLKAVEDRRRYRALAVADRSRGVASGARVHCVQDVVQLLLTVRVTLELLVEISEFSDDLGLLRWVQLLEIGL
jgi:hypothetical protein